MITVKTDSAARAALSTNPALHAEVIALGSDVYAAWVAIHCTHRFQVARSVVRAWEELSEVGCGPVGQTPEGGPVETLGALIRRAGSVRRMAWVFAAEDGADILHTGPRTRVAHAVSAALGHLQSAAEKLRKE